MGAQEWLQKFKCKEHVRWENYMKCSNKSTFQVFQTTCQELRIGWPVIVKTHLHFCLHFVVLFQADLMESPWVIKKCLWLWGPKNVLRFLWSFGRKIHWVLVVLVALTLTLGIDRPIGHSIAPNHRRGTEYRLQPSNCNNWNEMSARIGRKLQFIS